MTEDQPQDAPAQQRGMPGAMRRERISAMAEEYRLLALTGADTQGHMPDPWGACSGCPSGTDWDACPVIAQAKGAAPPS